jgi:DNA processing protein
MVHVAGDAELYLAATAVERPVVSVVGARRATEYGLGAARAIGRGLAAADVPVVSGMALGVDSAAHAGAVEVGGPTVAVLAGGADRPYPQSKRRLYAAIRRHGCVVAELPPGFVAFKWSFPARNRIIAALGRVTVVVEARERSGSLITAELARDLGRDVAAVPGRVSSPLAAGTNALLKDGAAMVRGPEDALDLACGVGEWHERDRRDQVPRHLRPLLTAVAEGHETLDALAAAGVGVGEAMAGLAELEMLGHVRRVLGGRYLPAA